MCLHVYELDNDWIDYFILQNDNSVGRVITFDWIALCMKNQKVILIV